MTTVQSLADLEKIRAQALYRRQQENESGRIQITVGKCTPSLATGGNATLKTILDFIAAHNLENITVNQTGWMGMDSYEPIIKVEIAGQPIVIYGNVNATAARRIMEEHVLGGKIVPDYHIEFA